MRMDEFPRDAGIRSAEEHDLAALLVVRSQLVIAPTVDIWPLPDGSFLLAEGTELHGIIDAGNMRRLGHAS